VQRDRIGSWEVSCLVVNLKTAKALGLDTSPGLVLRADALLE
jgi:hypothetical protein